MVTISKATFDTTGVSNVVSGTGGQQIKIVGIVIINNDTDKDNYTIARLLGWSTQVLYGSTTYGVFLTGNGGKWGLHITRDSIKHPYFILDAGRTFTIVSNQSKRISGAVWYYKE